MRKARMIPRLLAFLSVIAVTLGILSPGQAKASSVDVVATTAMIADAVSEVGGDRVQVITLMGPGVDPHAYRQTRSDIVNMSRADLVLWNGLYLEAQLEDLLNKLSERQSVVALGDRVSKDLLLAHDDYQNRFDPHLWMDPEKWRFVVEGVRDALIAVDSWGEDTYRANAERYLKDLADVSAYATSRLATVPSESRVLLTAHDAFNYFGDAYGFEVMGIQGISTESEAGLKRIQDLVDMIVERNISAVFVESSVSDRNIRALIEGAAAKGHTVTIGGELFSDAMGQPGTYEGTYIGMIDHNTTIITRALGGATEPRGMNGRLAAGS